MSLPLPSLLEADRRCIDAAELLIDTLEIVPSPAAYRHLLDGIGLARALARSADPDPGFERNFARHLEASWTALEKIVQYRFEWPRVPVATILDAIAGERALPRLEETISAIDQDRVYAYLDLRQRFRAERVQSGIPEARPLLEKMNGEIAGLFRRWLVAREGDLPGLDATVVLGPGDLDRSWYEPARHRVVVGPGEYMVFDRGGRLVASPVVALQGLAHELAGHAVQDSLSKDLPDPLRPDHRGRLRFASLPVAEGFAHFRALLALPFANENRAELGLEDRDLELLRWIAEMSFLHNAMPACAGANAARARQEPGFDAASHLTALTGQIGFGEMIARAASDPVNRVLYNTACFFGFEAVRGAAADLERQGIEDAERVRRLGRGGWALPVYRDAVVGARGKV